MNYKTLMSIIILGFFFPLTTNANTIVEFGFAGSYTCDLYVDVVNNNPERSKAQMDFTISEWAMGYITGKNSERTLQQGKVIIEVEDIEDYGVKENLFRVKILNHISTYCIDRYDDGKSLRSSIVDAVEDFYQNNIE